MGTDRFDALFETRLVSVHEGHRLCVSVCQRRPTRGRRIQQRTISVTTGRPWRVAESSIRAVVVDVSAQVRDTFRADRLQRHDHLRRAQQPLYVVKVSPATNHPFERLLIRRARSTIVQERELF